ncbi:MAG TPA: hypothetical protein VGW38_08300, partial [Chloroflexota bacterium]|nr:hypothetical protein [Chloroflexota bacterium]
AWQQDAFDGALATYLHMREDVAATRYEQIAARCRAAGVNVFGFVPLTGGEDGSLERVTSLLDLGLAPVPSSGAGAEPVTRRKQLLRDGAQLIAHGHPASHPSGEDFISRILACRDAGADGFGCYNYGLVRPAHLEWVRRAIDAWRGA